MTPKLIEFCGLPGSGKSTIAVEVARRLHAGDHSIITRHAALADDKPVPIRHVVRARYVISSALRKPGLFVTALSLIHQDGQPTAKALAKVCWNMWCVLGWYVWLERNRAGIAVVDQGILQAIWSVRLSALRETADWAEFLADLKMIDGIIIVDCTPEVSQQRLAVRSGNTTRLSQVSVDDPAWQVAQRAHEQASREGISVAPVLHITNGASEDLDAGVADILSWIYAMQDTEFRP